jgi:hypothetical protein
MAEEVMWQSAVDRAEKRAHDPAEDDIEESEEENGENYNGNVDNPNGQVIEIKSNGVSGLQAHTLPRGVHDRRRAVWRPVSEDHVPTLQMIVGVLTRDLERVPRLKEMLMTELAKVKEVINVEAQAYQGKREVIDLDIEDDVEEDGRAVNREVIDLTEEMSDESVKGANGAKEANMNAAASVPSTPLNTPAFGPSFGVLAAGWSSL